VLGSSNVRPVIGEVDVDGGCEAWDGGDSARLRGLFVRLTEPDRDDPPAL
jgi:hypothetical protein